MTLAFLVVKFHLRILKLKNLSLAPFYSTVRPSQTFLKNLNLSIFITKFMGIFIAPWWIYMNVVNQSTLSLWLPSLNPWNFSRKSVVRPIFLISPWSCQPPPMPCLTPILWNKLQFVAASLRPAPKLLPRPTIPPMKSAPCLVKPKKNFLPFQITILKPITPLFLTF